MSFNVFLLVLLAAALHACWNLVSKKSKSHSTTLLWVSFLVTSLFSVPIAFYITPFQDISKDAWFFVFLSGFVHSTYIFLLGKSYEIGRISTVYPIMRGVGVLGTALFAAVLGIDSLSTVGVLGICGIVIGSSIFGFKELPDKDARKAFLVAVGVGINISVYSIVDKYAVGYLNPITFVILMNLVSPLFGLPMILIKYKRETIETFRFHKKEVIFIGFSGLVTYSIVMYAFSKAQVSYVVGLKEISIVFASLLGVFLLKETVSKRKIVGIVLIALGAGIIKVA